MCKCAQPALIITKMRAHSASSKRVRSSVTSIDGNEDIDELDTIVPDEEWTEDDQAKTDAAVQRGEELVKQMPEGDDEDLNLDLQCQSDCIRETEKCEKATNAVH